MSVLEFENGAERSREHNSGEGSFPAVRRNDKNDSSGAQQEISQDSRGMVSLREVCFRSEGLYYSPKHKAEPGPAQQPTARAAKS